MILVLKNFKPFKFFVLKKIMYPKKFVLSQKKV
jgi:hypothetical protein